MNNLSWFLYLAEVLSSTGSLAVFLSIVTGIGSIVGLILYFISMGDNDINKGKDASAWVTFSGKLCVRFIPFFLFFSIYACLVPSKTTMYMIAASQLGEEIARTQAAGEVAKETQEIAQMLSAKIKEFLAPAAKK